MKYLLLAFIMAGIFSCDNQNDDSAKSERLPTPKTERQKFSYSIAYDMAQSFRNDSFPMDFDYFKQGLMDVFNDNPHYFTQEDRVDIMEEFQKYMTKKMARGGDGKGRMDSLGKLFMKETPKLLEANRNKAGVTVTKSGLHLELLKDSKGKSPDVDDMVKINIVTTLTNGDTVTNTLAAGTPVSVPVGGGFPGLVEALKSMKVGQKIRMVAPPELAFGAQGYEPMFPPMSAVICEIELLEIEGKVPEDMKRGVPPGGMGPGGMPNGPMPPGGGMVPPPPQGGMPPGATPPAMPGGRR